jgi:hypothetical protein
MLLNPPVTKLHSRTFWGVNQVLTDSIRVLQRLNSPVHPRMTQFPLEGGCPVDESLRFRSPFLDMNPTQQTQFLNSTVNRSNRDKRPYTFRRSWNAQLLPLDWNSVLVCQFQNDWSHQDQTRLLTKVNRRILTS